MVGKIMVTNSTENKELLKKVEDVAAELRDLLEKSVKKNLTRDMLFSGGIDTSILAIIVSEDLRIRGFTCAFKEANALDIKYANQGYCYLYTRC